MKHPKYDGVIESVRYSSDGRIALVRIYERRGAVWSDRVIMDRQELVQRLEKGLRLVTGKRLPYRGATFEAGTQVHLNGAHIVTRERPAGKDNLTGIPSF